MFDAILNRKPVPVGRLNPSVPAELDRSIDKALEKEKRFRYQHASELRADLERLRRDLSSPSHAVAEVRAIQPEAPRVSIPQAVEDPIFKKKTPRKVFFLGFIPGVGARLESPNSYIEYELPQPVVEGEYSALVSGLSVISRNEDPKWRVLSMREGYYGINDNIYRMTIDKRGNGAVAWRFITGNNRSGRYIETVSFERRALPFHEDLTYFIRASWAGGSFRVTFQEGGVDGNTIYDLAKGYQGSYTPFPHVVEAGSPYAPGDRGEASSVAGMVIRQIWVSPNPRPAYANK